MFTVNCVAFSLLESSMEKLIQVWHGVYGDPVGVTGEDVVADDVTGCVDVKGILDLELGDEAVAVVVPAAVDSVLFEVIIVAGVDKLVLGKVVVAVDVIGEIDVVDGGPQ